MSREKNVITSTKSANSSKKNWGVHTINGTPYVYFRKNYPHLRNPKIFYGKTEIEVKKKQKKFEQEIKPYQKIVAEEIPKAAYSDTILFWLKTIKPYDGTDTRAVTLDSYEDIILSHIEGTTL